MSRCLSPFLAHYHELGWPVVRLESRENMMSRCLSPFLAHYHQLGWPVVKGGQAPKQRTTFFHVES